MADLSSQINHQVIAEADWTDEESVALLSSELWMGRDYKSREEILAYVNEAFLRGDQWLMWDERLGRMVEDDQHASHRARLVYNDILAQVEARTAKFDRQRRVWSTAIQPGDPQARVRQRITDQVMGAYWSDVLKMDEKLALAIQWAMSSAAVFFIPFWNPTKGPVLRIDLKDWLFEAQFIADPLEQQEFVRRAENRFFQLFGQEALQQGFHEGPSGQMEVRVAPLFEVAWWPFNVTLWEDVRVWQWTRKMTVDDVSESFGLTREEVRDRASSSQSSNTGGRLGRSRASDRYFWGDDDGAVDKDDSVLVHTVYRQPSLAFPKGRQAVVLGHTGQTVFLGDLQNAYGRVPIIPLVEKPIRGSVMGTCLVDQLRSPQEHINVSASQAADYAASRVAPPLVVFDRKQVNRGAASNKPGKIWQADSPDRVPTSFKMPDIPIDFFQFQQQDRLWMERIGGLIGSDAGRPSDDNIRSGRAIIALREENNVRLRPFGKAIDRAMSVLGNFVLADLQKNVRSKRILEIIGEDNELELIEFRGEDLQPGDYGSSTYNKDRIRVTVFSNIPRSDSELANHVNFLLQAGMFGPEDRNEVLDILGMHDFRRRFDKTRLDTSKQSREIKRWEAGQLVGLPTAEDDDRTHIEMIEQWKKTEDYRLIAQQQPKIAQDVVSHLEAHKVNQARKVVESEYLLRRADVSLWMQHRAQLLAGLAAGDPQMAAQIANLVFPAPLLSLGLGGVAGADSSAGKSSGGGRTGNEKKKRPGDSKPGPQKQSRGPEFQGVPKENQ